MNSTLTRRRLIRSSAGIALATPLAGLAAGCGDDSETSSASASTATNQGAAPPRNGDEALDILLAGNRRYAAGQATHQGHDSVRRAEIAQGQEPFAIVLGCSDSRVPPEVVFDQGLGDLFVIRVAGNTATDPLLVGSIEYAAEHLGSVLLMVLGHESCGAVKAAIAEVTEGHTEPGSIGDVVAPIVPVVKRVEADDNGLSEDQLVAQSVTANVEQAVKDLTGADPLITHLVEDDKLKIVGAEYELQTGEVKVLDA